MKFRETVFVLCLCGIFTVTYGRNFYVATPKYLRLNAEETVVIAMDGSAAALVTVKVLDHPLKTKTIASRQVALEPNKPKVFNIRLDPNEFPQDFFKTGGGIKYVYLTANFQAFSKEIVIPVTTQSGYVFIQTDKPIYTPTQKVQIRIIPVSEEIRQSKEPFLLIIKNPLNITIEEKKYNEKHQKLNTAFVTHIHKFPSHPIEGEWSAIVRYGHNLEHNSTVRFTVKKYVVPTFTVELTTPDAILPKNDEIRIKVKAKYVYGKAMQGILNIRLGLKRPKSLTADVFGEITGEELDDEGTFTLKFRTQQMKDLGRIGWFPRIEGSHLFVEATVVDAATGNSETATDVKGRFSTTPFVISFDRCLRDFKPGLTSVFEADISFYGGSPAKDILAKITGVGDDGKALYVAQNTAVSDDTGKVTFEMRTETHHKKITITLETIDPNYRDSQARATFEQHSYKSASGAYMAISRNSPQRLRPGDVYGKEIHFEPPKMTDVYYMVIAKGKILDVYKLPSGRYKHQKVEFQISYDMIPSFRVLAFTHYRNELLVDSLKVDVESICHPNAQVDIKADFVVKEPGSNGKITVTGKNGCTVGLLGVDEAIYALSKRDLLTKARLFNTLASHDLGCGPGGGLTTESVLGNAGITMGTNLYTPSNSVHSCAVNIRKKREISEEKEEKLINNYKGFEKECCSLIRVPNTFNRTCLERAEIINNETKEGYPSCSKVFLECCREAGDEFAALGPWSMGHTIDNVPIEFVITPDQQEMMRKELTVRSDFRETWLFEDITIGIEDKKEVPASLPHSITTWVLQAVALSPEDGMCVAEPQRIESFKQIFLHLNLPYSVVRNEQVEIQATVFNYGQERIYAYVSMLGTKDLCSGAQPGELSKAKTVLVEPQSAATVTFPVIPMEEKDYPIEVRAMTHKGSDAIRRELRVVAEGVTKAIDISIKLDPTNMQRRKKREITEDFYTDQIDPTQNIQITAIKLGTPQGFVPGTARAYITAMGDTFGPAVETSVKNPQNLLKMPEGCGEQNMMKLAPTLYAINYLKASGKLTAHIEEMGYGYMRKGYSNELQFRNKNGAYSTFKNGEPVVWLTAFVTKVFCQASKYIAIDRKVLCGGVRWLISNQGNEGKYTESKGLWHKDMMGGVSGDVPFTAFVLIALSECDCDENNLILAKQRAAAYIEKYMDYVDSPLSAAIVSYALSLVNSEKKNVALQKLIAFGKYDEGTNRLYFPTRRSAQDIETAGYALMAFMLAKDMSRASSIVNWLNTKQLQSGAFKSTQDTVVALQALSMYAIDATGPVNLVSNITSSSDMKFHKTLTFTQENALMLQDARVDRVGGTIFIRTAGQGLGTLTAKLHYNVVVPPEDICKFNVTVHVTEVNDFVPVELGKAGARNLDNENYPVEVFKVVRQAMARPPAGMSEVQAAEYDYDEADAEEPLNFWQYTRSSNSSVWADRRVRRQNPGVKGQEALKIDLCVRYLGNTDAGMSIVDVGSFSGFEPHIGDLKKLENDKKHLIKLYEKSSRGVVFYLESVPTAQKYCFSYHLLRKFYIGNTQMSSIRVYDYYNPDESCTIFYRPDNVSPKLATICEEGEHCQCAEGGCPPDEPFKIYKGKEQRKTRDNLEKAFCETYDFVWKGELREQPVKQGNGFFNITFFISEVVKPGIEKKEDLTGETRTLLMRDTCPGILFNRVRYIVAAKDGRSYMNEKGKPWYRYMLDKTSGILLHTEDAEDQKQYRDVEHVTRQLADKGCNL